ncbi:hypothetical protein BDA96_01G395800 [Sorghum bicolor]|uniref:Uncharacterized protein n=2 Tax=Sorghum bicolor TaxID=4558 RepID=A0A921S2X7_SORBI|nr:hypothetical protein BDA96_01G395800 [Sorghum bicolor]KXG39866.2 hypothetical protein SORBI_3001G371750 [Sorghum bicolor]
MAACTACRSAKSPFPDACCHRVSAARLAASLTPKDRPNDGCPGPADHLAKSPALPCRTPGYGPRQPLARASLSVLHLLCTRVSLLQLISSEFICVGTHTRHSGLALPLPHTRHVESRCFSDVRCNILPISPPTVHGRSIVVPSYTASGISSKQSVRFW